MLFNSISFAIFLPIVFLLYWFIANGNLKLQNILLLLSSYFFYACCDWRFFFLLIFSIFLNYLIGLRIYKSVTQNNKIFWFWLCICINLGILCFFKYFNFFISSFVDGLTLIGIHTNFTTIKILLPIGISFYTFIGLSYIIDVFKNRIIPEKSFVVYSVFTSFFPLILAGPIERATHLLPQLNKKREFDYSKAVDGLRQILWGLFKKIVIADNFAEYTNTIFNNSSEYSGSTLVIGALFFTFQIYCDFSGYSDIAIGTSRLFGIDLLRNFASPYFSKNIGEFWKRWHISLSFWFRDYVFLPLAYSISGKIKANQFCLIRTEFVIYVVAISITFLLTGLWHGANYTFIIWGVMHALLLIVNKATLRPKKKLYSRLGFINNSFVSFIEIITTFIIIVFSWIIFRSDNLTQAVHYIRQIFSNSLFTMPHFSGIGKTIPIIFLTVIFILAEWIGRDDQFAIQRLGIKWRRPFKYALYYSIIFIIIWFGGKEQDFIYFQF